MVRTGLMTDVYATDAMNIIPGRVKPDGDATKGIWRLDLHKLNFDWTYK